jgi:hypothetical protein
LLLLELAAPALFALVRPSHTLSFRSRRWCVRTCLVAVESASAAANNGNGEADEGEEDTVLQRDAGRLPVQRQQLASQLQQLRLLHTLSLACAGLCASFFLLQLLLAFLGRLGIGVLLPLLLGARFDATATVAAASSSTAAAAASSSWALPFVCLLGAAVSLLNAAVAWRSWHSCVDWHGATASLLHVLHGQRATMLASRRLLLQLMERELVRRGYQLAAPSSSSSSTRTIERLDQAESSRRTAGTASLDTSLRIRTALQRVLQRQQDATAAFTDALVQCSAQLDGGGSFNSHSAPTTTAAASSLDASSPSSLSLVQLKSCRTAWLHNYDTTLRCLCVLLQRFDDYHQHSFALPGPACSFEQSLARQLQQLHTLTTQHATILQSLLPTPASGAELPGANAPSAGPNVASDSLQLDALALLATLPSSHPRRGVHSALQEARFVARTAERRMQLALEQQLLPLQPSSVEDNFVPVAAVETQLSSGWCAQLRAALALPAPLTTGAPPSDSFGTAAAASKPSSGSSQLHARLTPWDGVVSAALHADGAYLRQLAAQLRAHADTLEVQRRRLDAEHGLSDDSEQHQPSAAESTAAPLRPVALASSSSSSANPDDDDDEAENPAGGRGADAAVSKSELMAALSAMRNKTVCPLSLALHSSCSSACICRCRALSEPIILTSPFLVVFLFCCVVRYSCRSSPLVWARCSKAKGKWTLMRPFVLVARPLPLPVLVRRRLQRSPRSPSSPSCRSSKMCCANGPRPTSTSPTCNLWWQLLLLPLRQQRAQRQRVLL